jgi:hypothetical protein
VTGFDPVGWPRRVGGRSELGLRDEELVLEAQQDLGEIARRRGELRRGPTEVGSQLVEGAERADARGILPYAGATQETGLAMVAAAGV